MITISKLLWDDWNVEHITRHHVTPAEVEAVCQGEFLVRQGHSGRLLILGLTDEGKMLAVVLDHQMGETYYVVTARPADRQERRLYRNTKGGEADA